jgi:hypothetical protein
MGRSFFYLLLAVSPISSILVIPGLQGLTPTVAILCIMTVLGLVELITTRQLRKEGLAFLLMALTFIFFQALSQIFFSFYSGLNGNELILNAKNIDFKPFRLPIFSQGLYLLVSFLLFAVAQKMYDRGAVKYLVVGTVVFSLYGFYEVIYFYFTGSSGDFLTNRTFDSGDEHSGSLFQTYTLGDIQMQRLKSLSGEPSMYVFSVFPVFIMALSERMQISAAILLVSLLATLSSTVLVAALVYVISTAIISKSFKPIIYCLAVVVILSFAFFPLLQKIILEAATKVALESVSGTDRIGGFLSQIEFWAHAPPFIKLFGIGFGNSRSYDFFSTILVNCGVVGFLCWSAMFMFPVFFRGDTLRAKSLSAAVLSVYAMLMMSVSEFSYPILWIILAFAYAERRLCRLENEGNIIPEKAFIGNVSA